MGVSKTISEIGFFVLAFVLYLAFILTTKDSICKFNSSNGSKVVVMFMALIYTLAMFGYLKIFKPFDKESYMFRKHNSSWGITPEKLCKGGPYMWQGNSPRAKMCKNLYSTQEGRDKINRYECGAGYTGMPGKNFRFTPVSDGNWNNARCNTQHSCDVKNNGIF